MDDTLPEMPDITPVQIIAWLTMIIGMMVDAAWIDGQTSKILLGVASIVVPVAWQAADAHIRHGRAKMVAAIAVASSNVATKP